jgi:hypothetical protein
MINKPNGYDEATAFTGEFETLEPGGKILVIKKAEEVQSSKGGRMFVFMFDIAEGDEKGFFERQWNADKERPMRKWRGTYNQLMEGKSLPFFKGLITSIEESNPGYKWNWDETTLKGKLIGGIFGREEYRKQNGDIGITTKCQNVRSVQAIREGVPVPEDKRIADDGSPALTTPKAYNFEELGSDEELPF